MQTDVRYDEGHGKSIKILIKIFRFFFLFPFLI